MKYQETPGEKKLKEMKQRVKIVYNQQLVPSSSDIFEAVCMPVFSHYKN